MNKYYNHGDKFIPGTTVRSDAANAKFDGIETAFDQTEIDTNRSIKLPIGESVEITQTGAGRANTVIGFDEDGDVALLPGAGRWTGNYQTAKLYTVRDIFRDAAGVIGLNNLYIVTKNFASTNLVADAANYDLLINVADIEAAKQAAQAARNAAAASATQSANSATASSGSATSSANSATQSANSASFATTEANRSTTQANRAKTEADRAESAANSVDTSSFVTTSSNQTVGGTKTFSNPITASLNGNANTATRLQNSRTINGVSFNGSSNITITANTPNALTFGDGLSSSGTFNGGAARTVAVDGSVVRTSGTQSITGSKTFTSLIGGSISGNAASATVLQNIRTINGVNFNGSSNITIKASTPNVLTAGDGITSSGTFDGGTARTFAVDSSVTRNSASQTLTNKTIGNPTVTNYTEQWYSATGSRTINLSQGTLHVVTTNGNITITLPAAANGKSFTVVVAYGGVHNITWAGGTTIRWNDGTVPTPTSVNGKRDIFTFIQIGSVTYGSVYGQNF